MAGPLERYRSIIAEWTAFTEAVHRPEPTVFRVRTGRVDEAVLLDELHAQGFRTRPLEGQPSFHQVEEEPYPVSMSLEHWHGLLYVQQASTGVAAPVLGPRPGERVLDLCAAPGGKTAHAADLMEDRGCLVASEISEDRTRGLLGNMYRLGCTNVLAVAGDGRDFPLGARFDRVLVDAPCSGEGTLRRRGGRPPHQSASFLRFVTSMQDALLARAIELTRPGGEILYVTCTFAPEENEAVVSRALERHPVELEPIVLPVPHAPGVTSFEGARYDPRVEGTARVYPHHLDSGGLFLARLRRLDDGSPAGPARARSDAPDASSLGGWTPVPAAFPEVGPGGQGGADGMDGADGRSRGAGGAGRDAEALVADAMEELSVRFGVRTEALDRYGWTVRGDRVWMHTVDRWPLEAWAPGAWRPISVGVRAIEFDTRGRPRPTNDALRLLSGEVRGRRIRLDLEGVRALLARKPLPAEGDERGPVALDYDGRVIGRGALTGEGLKSEIPKARAVDLGRALDRLELPTPVGGG